jgi:MYXO-CTERM domain-containing protein
VAARLELTPQEGRRRAQPLHDDGALHSKPTNYVFAHESGHMLFGWPDLYGVGDYCIMANRDADTNPVGINDAFRVDQGWLDVVDIDSSTNAVYTSAPDAPAYRYVNATDSGEFFLWSNVQPTQEWVSLKGGGILLWHFDNSIAGNAPPATLQLAVVQGGGTRILSATTWPSPGTAATDFFYKGNNSEFSASTKPASAWNNKSASGLRIYDISANGAQMTFSVGSGALPDGGPVAGSDGGLDAPPDSVNDANGIRDARDGRDGTTGTGGATPTGGAAGTGGMNGTGGVVVTGGALSVGGATPSSTVASGGARSTGGSASGGSSALGGAAGGATGGRGGQTGAGGDAIGGSSGAAGATPTTRSSSSGCSCSVGGSQSRMPLAGLVMLAVAWFLRYRRPGRGSPPGH